MVPSTVQSVFGEAEQDILQPAPKLDDKQTLKSVASAELQNLVALGLVRQKFVLAATPSLLAALEKFAQSYVNHFAALKDTIGSFLIRQKILTPQMVENVILADETNLSKDQSKRWLYFMRREASPVFKKMVKEGYIETSALVGMFRHHFKSAYDTNFLILKCLGTPGAGNAINWGMLDLFEYEAAQKIFLTPEYRYGEFISESDPLMRALRVSEFSEKKKRQIHDALPANDTRPFLVQLEEVWKHYAAESELFQKIAHENTVPAEERARNVERVNEWQAKTAKKPIASPQERFIDIYGRYHHAEMDPLMLAIITRTVGWYLDHGHAQLFTHARLVPDKRSQIIHGLESIPWLAKAFYRKASVLKVAGETFTASMLGANRMFLTHSQASEASNLHSIPIIGIATWRNKDKFRSSRPYALLAAEFDKDDPYRITNRDWMGEDYTASFRGIIGETLRAVREAENLEIARANDVKLVKTRPHRWRPANLKEFRYGS